MMRFNSQYFTVLIISIIINIFIVVCFITDVIIIITMMIVVVTTTLIMIIVDTDVHNFRYRSVSNAASHQGIYTGVSPQFQQPTTYL